jgi:hypothetical protein
LDGANGIVNLLVAALLEGDGRIWTFGVHVGGLMLVVRDCCW